MQARCLRVGRRNYLDRRHFSENIPHPSLRSCFGGNCGAIAFVTRPCSTVNGGGGAPEFVAMSVGFSDNEVGLSLAARSSCKVSRTADEKIAARSVELAATRTHQEGEGDSEVEDVEWWQGRGREWA